jgi:flagellar hook assembly protein FlgD
VTLEIFDAAGRRIATLVDRVEDTGDHEITWNGTGTDGRQVASGIYLYRLTAGKRTLTRKMALLR